jgi:hypothetical protein
MRPGEGTRRRPGSFHDREATEEALRSAAVGLCTGSRPGAGNRRIGRFGNVSTDCAIDGEREEQ